MKKTVSFETAVKLREVGLDQGFSDPKKVLGNFFWADYPHLKKHDLDLGSRRNDENSYYAPTTDELLEELPDQINSVYFLSIYKRGKYFDVGYNHIEGGWLRSEVFTDESLPETLAKLWLWLKKEKLL